MKNVVKVYEKLQYVNEYCIKAFPLDGVFASRSGIHVERFVCVIV